MMSSLRVFLLIVLGGRCGCAGLLYAFTHKAHDAVLILSSSLA